MRKVTQKAFFTVVCLALMAFFIPSYSAAFGTIKVGEESELSIYGFLRNNTGMFLQNPTYPPLNENHNQLATERTWLRGNVDFKYSPQLRFGSVIQFVYEPEYDVDKGAIGSYWNPVGPPVGDLSRCCGKEYSEYNNITDVLREVYVEWKPSKTISLKFGRQIAIWGEALTTRVGDVIQPEDQRFTLAFANLEDTRIPQWMVRGIFDFPDLSSSIEGIVNPNITQGAYLVNRAPGLEGPGSFGQRFSIPFETRFSPPFSVTNPIIFGNPSIVVPNPFSRDWIHIPGGPGTGWFPTDLPYVDVRYPSNTWDNFRAGLRTNTTFGGFNFGLSYFHTQNYDPVPQRGNIIPGKFDPATHLPLREFTFIYPNIDIFGAYMNKQLPWPGVVRAEMIYVPNKPFPTQDLTIPDAVVRRDYVKYMVAYDLTGFLFFSWHKTAPFDITFEHVGEWIPNPKFLQYIQYDTRWRTWNPSLNMRISTNWRYNQFATELIVGYLPANGNSGLIMPAIKYMPPWLNKQFSVELKYIGIWGKKFEGVGILRDKDMLVLTTQFNW